MASHKSTQTSHVEQREGLSQEWLLMKGAQDLRNGDILVDLVLVVDGVKLPPCHKFMLAASSPYFRAMFSHGMLEQDKKEIDIVGVERNSLQLVIEYIYTGQICITDNNVQGLMSTCSLLQITNLYAKCREYMVRRLDVSNCISVYQFARSMYSVKLQGDAFRFIARRFNEIAKTTEFITLDKDELIDIISSDDLWVTQEETVYEAVLQWLGSDAANKSRHIAEVFAHIRFALMKDDFLESCVMQEELVFENPQLRVQIEAAQKYISEAAKSDTQLLKFDEDAAEHTENATTDNPKDSNKKTGNNRFPYYTVSVDGLEDAVRIPLAIQLRAGMNTKELLLFSNGRRTLVMNPTLNSEYYGCVEMKPEIKDGETPDSIPGWSPDIPIMKNPEAYVTKDGTVYILGGLEIEKSSPTNIRTRVYSLNPDTLGWVQCASMPAPRCMAAYGDGCGHLYVLGGKALSQGEVVSAVQKYSRIENEWEEVPPMPVAVYGHGTASLKDKIYVTGGKTAAKTLLSLVHCLDCELHQWVEITPLAAPRFLHGIAVNPETEELYVIGGSSEDGVLDSVEILQLSENRWRFGESFPGNRCAQFVMFFNGELYTVGGYVTERNSEGRYESKEIHDVFALDASTNQWSRKVRRVRGTTACSMACVKVSLNTTKLTRSRISTLMD